MGQVLVGDPVSALQHPHYSGDEPGLPTVMLVMLGTGQVGVPLDPHRLGGRRSIMLTPRAPCLDGFMEQDLLPRCINRHTLGLALGR